MYQYENLWIKISDDFHAEINPLLEQLNPDAINHYWFKKKSIQGKFFVVNDLLLSLNGTDVNQYPLIKLKNILEAYKIRIKSYLGTHNIATCFVYINAENMVNTENYFNQFKDYFNYSYFSMIAINSCFMFPLDFIPFPNDCSYKLIAKILNDNILIEEKYDPLFEIEKQQRELMGNIERTRDEQYQIEINIQKQNPELWKKGEDNALNKFKEFAQKTHEKNIQLVDDFNRCIILCNSLIEKQQKDTTPANLPETEKIYAVLINGYIQEPLEKFQAIFQSNYSGEKLTWLKTGTELKYFVDRLNEKLNLSNEINKWVAERFELLRPVKNMASYLSKQTSKGEYQLLKQGNKRKDPLYKIFLE